MQTVLLISDNQDHLATARAALRADGHALRAEPTIERALLAVREQQPDLLCLDLSSGAAMNGLAALLRDQQQRGGVPVLAITTREQFYLVGPGSGVADVIVTPLDRDELQLRVARLVSAASAPDSQLLRRGDLLIDQERYTVRLGDEAVDLTYKEYELLRFLAQNPGKAFTREMLLNQVWGYDYYGGARTVDVHIRRIRAKIERHEPYIETVRNVGYRFVEEPRTP